MLGLFSVFAGRCIMIPMMKMGCPNMVPVFLSLLVRSCGFVCSLFAVAFSLSLSLFLCMSLSRFVSAVLQLPGAGIVGADVRACFVGCALDFRLNF